MVMMPRVLVFLVLAFRVMALALAVMLAVSAECWSGFARCPHAQTHSSHIHVHEPSHTLPIHKPSQTHMHKPSHTHVHKPSHIIHKHESSHIHIHEPSHIESSHNLPHLMTRAHELAAITLSYPLPPPPPCRYSLLTS